MAMNKSPKISVLLVDDHAVVREGYRRLLERHGDIVVVGEASGAADAHALFGCLDPQVVVLDITLPGTNGIEVMRRMLHYKRDARVLIFSMHEDDIFATRSMRAGAFGYVTKASAPEVLVDAVLSVARGDKYLSPKIAQRLALNDFEDASSVLTGREMDVLRLLAQGQSVNKIAQTMGLSSKTVANHQSAIKLKLGTETAIALMRKAIEMGLDPL
jgi:two-component system, NarL family, invasion response regulator UvrY